MGFPTVKSDPWKKKPRKSRATLWNSKWWKELCERAKRDIGTFDRRKYPISDACVELIRDFNRRIETD